jgi:hypothetical protein
MPSPKLFAQDGDNHREFTDAEYAQHSADAVEFQRQADLATAKAAARQAILDRLGLTADEAALLLS